MDIKQLETFLYVVEHRSFSKAGQLLHLTQPTVSAHIASLERELQTKLILRTTKETRPSEAGLLLYPYARQILELRESARQTLQEHARRMHGTVLVAASTIPGQYFLPSVIQTFRGKYPDVKFDIRLADSAEVAEMVAGQSAELGFTGTRPTSGQCICRPFARDELVVITPTEQRFDSFRETGFPPQQLLHETLVARESGSGTRCECERFLRENGIDPGQLNIAVELRSTEGINKLVSEGAGVAVVSRSACRDYCQFGKVWSFAFSHGRLQRELYVIRRKNSVLSPVAQAFFEFARKYFEAEP